MAKKKTEPTLTSWEQVDSALARLVTLDARRKQLEAALTSRVKFLREQYAPDLDQMGAEEKTLRADVAAFCAARKKEAFSNPRTVERVHALLSYCLTPPAVTPLSRKWTWAKIEDALFALPRWAKAFVRPGKPTVNKEAILDAYSAGDVTDEQLAEFGVVVDQVDALTITLKTEEAAPIQTDPERAAG